MIAMIESAIDHWVEVVVGAAFSIFMGYWLLSWILPLDDWVDSLKKLIFGKKKVKEIILVKCANCGNKNTESAKFCFKCGTKL
jgi:hypothetical protein